MKLMKKPQRSDAGEWLPPPPTKPVPAWALSSDGQLVLNSHWVPYIFKTRLRARSFFTHARYKPVKVLITVAPPKGNT